MKITFKNLGCIKETSIDLRPLTIIIGPNNSNKTYIAYSIYGIMRRIASNSGIHAFKLPIKEVDGNAWEVELNDELCETYVSRFQKIVDGFKDSLTNFFQDSSGKLFTNTEINLRISKDEVREAFSRINFGESSSPFGHNSIFTSYDKETRVFRLQEKLDGPEEEDDDDLEIKKTESITRHNVADLKWLVSYHLGIAMAGRAFALPAERNALVLTYKLLASRRLKLLTHAQRRTVANVDESARVTELLREQGEIGYPQPVEDFLEFLGAVELQKVSSEVDDSRIPFVKLADEIEKSIQNRNRANFKGTRMGGREIKVRVRQGLDIDLHNASSSIKQLVPIILYLRYRARKNDFLVIDEPEMNLHPESQAKFLEILAMIVNLGINVTVTTHSPYFMSHLNNLVSGDLTKKGVAEKQAKNLYLKKKEAFLDIKKVSAYEMRNNELCDLKDPDFGIKWDTLSDVSSEIQQKYFEIYNEGKKSK